MPPARHSANRVCSECGGSLEDRGPHAKTCSDNCRSARSRRIKRDKKRAGETYAMPASVKAVQEFIRGEVEDVGKDVIREELQPIVREMIANNEAALIALDRMIGLTPLMVDAIEADIRQERDEDDENAPPIDPTIRQRAYTLVAKYTLGNPAVIVPEEQGPTKLDVHFPGMEASAPAEHQPIADIHPDISPELIEGDAVQVFECERCHREQPEEERYSRSERCKTCQEELREMAAKYV